MLVLSRPRYLREDYWTSLIDGSSSTHNLWSNVRDSKRDSEEERNEKGKRYWEGGERDKGGEGGGRVETEEEVPQRRKNKMVSEYLESEAQAAIGGGNVLWTASMPLKTSLQFHVS